jgi:uncharacterized membrane protein
MEDRYNYEDSFLTKEEKKNKIYNDVIEKNNKQQRKLLKIVFPILGGVYVILGIIMILIEDEEVLLPGIIFTAIGLFFVLLGFIISKTIKTKKYTNEEIENRFMNPMNKVNANLNILYEARIKILEEEVIELRKKVEDLERRLR